MASLSPGRYIKGFLPQVIGRRVENKYLCSHCRRVLRNPVQSFCGHRYCRNCVEHLLSGLTSVKCQSCVQENNEDEDITMEMVFPDNATKRELYALPAQCPNEGCPWTGKLKLLEKHEPECERRQEECECGGFFRPADFAAHRGTECTHRLLNCPHCRALIQFRHTKTHEAECPRIPVCCPRCGEDGIPRMALDGHMKNPMCKLRVLCPYKCGELVEKDAIDAHVQSTVRVHLDAMGTIIQKLEQQVQQQMEEMQSSIQFLSSTLGAGAAGGTDNEVDMETVEAGGDLIGRVDALDQKVIVTENFGIVLKREIGKMSQKLDAFASERAADHDQMMALKLQMAQLLNNGMAVGGASPVPDVPTSTDGTLLWKITDFPKKRQDAASGGPAVITSQPFYTSPSGYKLCARIYPNGDGVGKTTYLSVFIVVMKGPYDAILKWPFRQKITLSLQDQGPKKNHIVDSFRPDPAAASFQRPVSELNTASGCPMFAKQSLIGQIGEYQYIKDGQLFLKITVDTTGL